MGLIAHMSLCHLGGLLSPAGVGNEEINDIKGENSLVLKEQHYKPRYPDFELLFPFHPVKFS